jgi:hypothetical protein
MKLETYYYMSNRTAYKILVTNIEGKSTTSNSQV